MPVAVIDIGTNTTRLLVAEVEDGQVVELERRTVITSLGQGVDSSGRLAQEAMDRVSEAIAVYREVIDRLGVERVVALATSAMRDAENGPEFRDYLKQRFGIEPRTISGDEEARLTFLGATSDRNDDGESVVIDIGGGSTEYVVGRPGHDPEFHVSTQMGSVRFTERFENLEEMGAAVRETVPDVSVEQGIAVAGTATSLAAIDGCRPDPWVPAEPGDLRAPRGDAGGDAARGAAAGEGSSSGPGAHDRRRRRDPDGVDARARARGDRGQRTRHPARRRAWRAS